MDLDVDYTTQQELVLWNIRLPRILMGVLGGGGLAVAGAALQGIFRNPLADPALIGSSSGAAVGAVSTIMLGIAPFGSFSLPVAAFVGSLLLTFLVYLLSRHGGRTEVVTLILTGVALNAIAWAALGLMNFYATDASCAASSSGRWARSAARPGRSSTLDAVRRDRHSPADDAATLAQSDGPR